MSPYGGRRPRAMAPSVRRSVTGSDGRAAEFANAKAGGLGQRSVTAVEGRRGTAAPTGARSVFAVPGFTTLWYSGWLWHLSRWMASFLGAYVVNQQTGSPRLVQLTGVAMWAPLLFGGAIGGMVSDRVDRRRTLLYQLALTAPLAASDGVPGDDGSPRDVDDLRLRGDDGRRLGHRHDVAAGAGVRPGRCQPHRLGDGARVGQHGGGDRGRGRWSVARSSTSSAWAPPS